MMPEKPNWVKIEEDMDEVQEIDEEILEQDEMEEDSDDEAELNILKEREPVVVKEEIEEPMRENEMGEEIKLSQLIELAIKVRKLEPKQISQIFIECGWEEIEAEQIDKMKKEENYALLMITALFDQTAKDEFLYIIKDQIKSSPKKTKE